MEGGSDGLFFVGSEEARKVDAPHRMFSVSGPLGIFVAYSRIRTEAILACLLQKSHPFDSLPYCEQSDHVRAPLFASLPLFESEGNIRQLCNIFTRRMTTWSFVAYRMFVYKVVSASLS